MNQDGAKQEVLKRIQEKIRARIRAGRDPRIAQWQAALEALLVRIQAHLVPGEMITFESLKPDEIKQFHSLQILLDLSPFVTAVFLPPGVLNRLIQSKNTDITGYMSDNFCKVLVTRIDNYDRILTAEISPTKSVIEIFDDGSMLGSYNYNTNQECLSDLSKIIWLHLKPKEWTKDDYIKYTEGWFFRSASNKLMDLPINENQSYIHHPVLLQLNVVKAIFKLTKATLLKLCGNVDNAIAMSNAASLHVAGSVQLSREQLAQNDSVQKKALQGFFENKMLELLKLLRSYEAVNFKGFSDAEQKEFKLTFSQVLEEIFQEMMEQI